MLRLNQLINYKKRIVILKECILIFFDPTSDRECHICSATLPALTGTSTVSGVALAWQQMTALLIKRFHHSRRDWKGLIAQILLPVLFVVCAMGLGSIKNDLQHYPELELSPALYNFHPGYSFFRSVPSTNQQEKELLKDCYGVNHRQSVHLH